MFIYFSKKKKKQQSRIAKTELELKEAVDKNLVKSREVLKLEGEVEASLKQAQSARNDAAQAYRETGSIQAKLNNLQNDSNKSASMIEINSKQEMMELHEQISQLRQLLKKAELSETQLKQAADVEAAREEADRAYEEVGEMRAKYETCQVLIEEQSEEIKKLTQMLESEDLEKVPKFKAQIKALGEDLALIQQEKADLENQISDISMERNNEEIVKLTNEIQMMKSEMNHFEKECQESNQEAVELLTKTQSLRNEIEVHVPPLFFKGYMNVFVYFCINYIFFLSTKFFILLSFMNMYFLKVSTGTIEAI